MHNIFFSLWVLVWPFLVGFLEVRSRGFPATPLSMLPENIEITPNTLVLDFFQEISTCLAIIICDDDSGLEGFARATL